MEFKLAVQGNVIEQLPPHKLSILVSTEQSAKLFIFSANGSALIKQAVLSEAPMGVAARGNQLAIAVMYLIIYYANHLGLARKYPDKSLKPDACFIPRTVSFTEEIACYDITFYKQSVLGINSDKLQCCGALWDETNEKIVGIILLVKLCQQIYDVNLLKKCISPTALSLSDPLH